jgi:hypothetical protein
MTIKICREGGEKKRIAVEKTNENGIKGPVRVEKVQNINSRLFWSLMLGKVDSTNSLLDFNSERKYARIVAIKIISLYLTKVRID